MKLSKKSIRIILIIFLIAIAILLLLIGILKKETKEEKPEEIKTVQTDDNTVVTERVRNRGEKERMQVYLAEFIKNLEKGEYGKAYNKLYPEFRENFFETEEGFKQYAKQNYSSLMAVEYEDIQRQGAYYILTVTITNLEEPLTTINQMFIIHETGLNEYQISFQVKGR